MGGGWDASQGLGDWREMRGGGARGVGRGANGSTEANECWWVAQRETDQSCPRIGRGRAVKAWPARARGSARERAAGLPASQPEPRTSAVERGRIAERGSGGASPQLSSAARAPHFFPSPPLALRPGVPGRSGGRDEEGGFVECGRRGAKRALPLALRRCLCLLARCRGPGRPHYAGGLPAAAMASRAVVKPGTAL